MTQKTQLITDLTSQLKTTQKARYNAEDKVEQYQEQHSIATDAAKEAIDNLDAHYPSTFKDLSTAISTVKRITKLMAKWQQKSSALYNKCIVIGAQLDSAQSCLMTKTNSMEVSRSKECQACCYYKVCQVYAIEHDNEQVELTIIDGKRKWQYPNISPSYATVQGKYLTQLGYTQVPNDPKTREFSII